jgi:hypothetical protein
VVDSVERREAPTGPVGGHRPAHALDRPARIGGTADLGWRIGLVTAAAVCLAFAPPVWLALPVAVGTTGVVLERVVRHRRRGLLDTVLVGVGGGIVAVGLLGLLLNFLPGGVTRTGWLTGGAALLVTALAWCARRPVPPSPLNRLTPVLFPATAVYTLLVGATLAAALLLAVRSTDEVQVPPLQLSASTAGGQTQISISSGTEIGPLDLVMQTPAGDVLAASSIIVGPDQAVSLTMTPPAGQSVVLYLTHPGETVPIREVIVQTAVNSGGP